MALFRNLAADYPEHLNPFSEEFEAKDFQQNVGRKSRELKVTIPSPPPRLRRTQSLTPRKSSTTFTPPVATTPVLTRAPYNLTQTPPSTPTRTPPSPLTQPPPTLTRTPSSRFGKKKAAPSPPVKCDSPSVTTTTSECCSNTNNHSATNVSKTASLLSSNSSPNLEEFSNKPSHTVVRSHDGLVYPTHGVVPSPPVNKIPEATISPVEESSDSHVKPIPCPSTGLRESSILLTTTSESPNLYRPATPQSSKPASKDLNMVVSTCQDDSEFPAKDYYTQQPPPVEPATTTTTTKTKDTPVPHFLEDDATFTPFEAMNLPTRRPSDQQNPEFRIRSTKPEVTSPSSESSNNLPQTPSQNTQVPDAKIFVEAKETESSAFAEPPVQQLVSPNLVTPSESPGPSFKPQESSNPFVRLSESPSSTTTEPA